MVSFFKTKQGTKPFCSIKKGDKFIEEKTPKVERQTVVRTL